MSTKPSTMTMLKLAANAEIRAAVTNLNQEIVDAGIDINAAVSLLFRTTYLISYSTY